MCSEQKFIYFIRQKDKLYCVACPFCEVSSTNSVSSHVDNYSLKIKFCCETCDARSIADKNGQKATKKEVTNLYQLSLPKKAAFVKFALIFVEKISTFALALLSSGSKIPNKCVAKIMNTSCTRPCEILTTTDPNFVNGKLAKKYNIRMRTDKKTFGQNIDIVAFSVANYNIAHLNIYFDMIKNTGIYFTNNGVLLISGSSATR